MRGRKEVVVFHSILGLRQGVRQFAEQLREAGHIVHTPDLYDGEVFDDMTAAADRVGRIGFDGVLARSQAAVASLPDDLVYAGFSNGGACAELLAATRHGARGAILLHAPLPIRALGWTVWPATVPVQVHFAGKDPIRSQGTIDALAASVRRSGASFEHYDYLCDGHLFAEPGRPAFSAPATALMLERVLAFLTRG